MQQVLHLAQPNSFTPNRARKLARVARPRIASGGRFKKRSWLVFAPVFVRRLMVGAALAALAALGAGCGAQGIQVPQSDPTHQGAVLFQQHCSGCHSLAAAGTQGSRNPNQVKYSYRTNGPDFNKRHETPATVLFAIRNGGFTGAIMPANVVVGSDQQQVADFVAKYAGRQAAPSQ